MAAYCRVFGVIHFTSPTGWLPVHRDQLRAQRSVTSMGKLYLFSLEMAIFVHVWPEHQELSFMSVCAIDYHSYIWKSKDGYMYTTQPLLADPLRASVPISYRILWQHVSTLKMVCWLGFVKMAENLWCALSLCVFNRCRLCSMQN